MAPHVAAATRRTRVAAALLAAAACAGCAHTASTPSCAPGLRPMVAERLYFGTRRPDGVVSAAEWSAFLDDTIAVRFPAGFTTWDANGGWRGADGRTVREPSHVVEVMHAADAPADAAIAATIADYRARFEQEAVLRVRAPACVAP